MFMLFMMFNRQDFSSFSNSKHCDIFRENDGVDVFRWYDV